MTAYAAETVAAIKQQACGKWRSILTALQINVPSTATQHGPCPTCGGKDRFRFDDQDGHGGWFCNQCTPHAGDGFALVRNVRDCSFPDAVQLVAGAVGYHPSQGDTPRRIVATYDYLDARGTCLFQVVRYVPKGFRQRRPDGQGGWIWNLTGIEPVLYHLPAVHAASSVLIVEGEKDVETAYRLGLPEGWAATCNPMGAGKWRASYSDVLQGKPVVILPDGDAPGETHAVQVTESLQGKAATVSRLTLPDGYKDLSEWATAGHTAPAFHALLHTAHPLTLSQASPPEPVGSGAGRPREVVGTAWPEPLPLVAQVEADVYPLDALPDIIRAAVEEVQGFTKAPLAMVASSALAALSVAVQAQYDVRRAEKLDGPVSLFFLTVADSGERKSTNDGFFLAPIRAYEAEQAEVARPAQQQYAASLASWQAKHDGIVAAIKNKARTRNSTDEFHEALLTLEAEKPIAPRVPAVLRGDDTPENLAWVLARQWPSAGVITAEAGIVFGSHGMGTDSIMRNLALLNTLWDGGTLKVGRRTSESFTVQGARLTMGLQVQEATLRSFFDRSKGLARGTGFCARFLFAWPASTQGSRFFTDPPAAWPALAVFHRRLTELFRLPVSLDAEGA